METKASVISLINEVRKRQCLWNKKDEYYKNRVYVDKVWDEVAMDLDKTSKYVNVTFQICFYHADTVSITFLIIHHPSLLTSHHCSVQTGIIMKGLGPQFSRSDIAEWEPHTHQTASQCNFTYEF